MSPSEILTEGVRQGHFPGGQLAASRECQRLTNEAAGLLSPEGPSTSVDALYDLASLTKALATTVLIGRALERGLCRLSDPVARYVSHTDPVITLQHLLEHAAGFPAHVRFDRRLPREVPPGGWPAAHHIIEDAAKTPREREPGASALYTDIGYILLGATIETIYAKPISSAFAELGTPLFYRDFRGPPAQTPSQPEALFAPTEGELRGEVHDDNCRAMGGAAGHAGLFGTAEGVLEVCESLVRAFHGERKQLLRPETVRRLWRPSQVPGSSWAMGWDRPSQGASTTGGRWPSTSVGHLGFTGTSVWIEPHRALIVVLVTNRVYPSRDNIGIRRVRPALYDAAWSAWSGEASIRQVK